MNPIVTVSPPAMQPLVFAAAVALSSVLLSMAASVAVTARPAPAPVAEPAPIPTSPAPVRDTSVPDAAIALRGAPEPAADLTPTF